jgi:peptidoglycan glycosyltransferase
VERRIRLLGAFLLACFLVLFLQLNNLQVREASALRRHPGNPRALLARYNESRGPILSADGKVVAESVRAHRGVYAYDRVYPLGPLFAGITGYYSYIYGLSGVEASENAFLESHTRPAKSIPDLFTNRTETDQVVLSVSARLQQAAANALAGRDGAVVLLDPATGAVLAMYANPTFDPNPLASQDPKTERLAWLADNTPDKEGFAPLLDLAYQRSFPPGSSFKVVTASAVYDHDPQLATKPYPVTSAIPLPDTNQTLHNYAYEACGGTMAQMLPPSCDTGFASIGLDLGAANLYAEATAFGFDQQPPLDIEGAAASTFPSVASFAHDLPFLAYSAIGQGNVSATVLQMALVASAIANGGVIMRPYVVASVRDEQGNLVQATTPRPWLRATSAETAAAVTGLMVQVAQHGTAYGVFPPSLDVAAKTGTAQTFTPQHYTDDWMIAFAPASQPRIAVAVVVPDQAPSATGAEVAGPIASAMLQAALAGAP